MGNIDIEKVLVSNKISFGKKNYKYFIGYLHNGNKIKPLNIMLLKTSTYVKIMMGKLMDPFFDWRWWLIRKI